MAFLDEEFNAQDMPQGTGNFDPLPAGWYTATISDAELKNTKAGNGQYISVRYAITGPRHQGRLVFGNLNIKNQSQKAEEIGRQQLGEIMRAVGLARVTDTDQLVGTTLQIKVDVKNDEKYGAGNEVRGFKSALGSAFPSAPSDATQASSPPAAAAKAAPPWAKK